MTSVQLDQGESAAVKLLAVSDVVLPEMQNADFLHRTYGDAEVLVSCGDMPVGYLDFISTVLNIPLLYVRGNHDTCYEPKTLGGDDLHRRVCKFNDYWFGGLEGSIRYNNKALQYSEGQMFAFVLQMMPKLLLLRSSRGYSLDIVVAHAPPQGVHDISDDYAHRGFKAFHYLIHWARPRYLLHGHVDTWDRRRTTETVVGYTTVININPRKTLVLCKPGP